MKILKTYKQLLEGMYNSPIKFLLEYESDIVSFSKKYPRDSKYVKDLLELDDELEQYYDGFKIEYGRFYIYFTEEILEDVFSIEDFHFNDFVIMSEGNYDYEIDELPYFINDKNIKLLKKILNIFNINDIDLLERFDYIINYKLYECNNIVNSFYTLVFQKKAKEIDNKIDNFFFDYDETNFSNIAVVIYKDYLTEVTSITKLLKNKKMYDIMAEIKDIKDYTTLNKMEEKSMNDSINLKLNEIFNYVKTNMGKIIDDMYNSTISIVNYTGLGDFQKELESDKYQTFYIENRKSTKIDNINSLKTYVKLTKNIKQKYASVIKSSRFNL